MKKNVFDDLTINDIFGDFGAMLGASGLFGGKHQQSKAPSKTVQNLKDGFTLVLIDTIKDNKLNYSYLYKDGVKISDIIFRAGGFCSGYKAGYCSLISYGTDINNLNIDNHVIIDTTGKIVLKQDGLNSLYHLDGILATMNKTIYNLLTGEVIVKGGNTMETKDFLFVDVSYDFTKQYKLGIYKISFKTGEVEIFEK